MSTHARLPALLISLCSVGCQFDMNEHVELGSATRFYDSPGVIDAVDIDVRFGTLRIQRTEGEQVKVVVEIVVAESRQAEFGGEPLAFDDHARVTFEGSRLIVEDLHRGQSDEQDWGVSFLVHLPDVALAERAVDVDASIGAGELHLALPSVGKIAIESGAGEVRVETRSVEGPVSISLGAGDCRFEVSESAPSNDVTLSVDVGGVRLVLPDEVHATLSAEAHIGDINCADRFGLVPERHLTAANVKGRIGDGGPMYTLRTSVGEISIR